MEWNGMEWNGAEGRGLGVGLKNIGSGRRKMRNEVMDLGELMRIAYRVLCVRPAMIFAIWRRFELPKKKKFLSKILF